MPNIIQNWKDHKIPFGFTSVIKYPENADIIVYDCTRDGCGYDPKAFGVGKYNEIRTMYTTGAYLSAEKENIRNIHIGIDLSAPAGTEIRSFGPGRVFSTGARLDNKDYGHYIITEHFHSAFNKPFWVLWGHLSASSVCLRHSILCEEFQAGEVIGYIGKRNENGNWDPHVHIQVSLERPKSTLAVDVWDGVCSASSLDEKLKVHPDPQEWFLGYYS